MMKRSQLFSTMAALIALGPVNAPPTLGAPAVAPDATASADTKPTTHSPTHDLHRQPQ